MGNDGKGVRRLTLRVEEDRAGQKVDTLLRKELGLSGTVIRRIKWLPEGILLDGERVFTSRRAEAGQVLSVLVADPELRSGVTPVPGPLDIVYEDGDMLVLHKAPGVLVDFHPVHRLDKGTSGLMVVAKHPHAQERLKRQLHTAAFRRVYLAVCLGGPQAEEGVVDAPIGMAEGSIVARVVRPDGLPARTRYRVLRRKGERVLVRLELETGRTHQIRVHMAHLGCPLAGDFLYGTEDRALIGRPALHSSELELLQPITGERLSFEAPLPADMRTLME